jgi:predicted HTH domain antitoxin
MILRIGADEGKLIDTNTNRAENLIMTANVELQLPESVHITDAEIKMIVAARLFDLGELSSGQAAKLAGITKREFIESVGRYGVSIFQYSAEELQRDLARK